jgi:DNA adenine methylase
MVLYPFTWPGSKYRARKFVTDHLPANKPDGPVQTYVEPFGGSAVVLLNRNPAPNEVYNDIDDRVVAFFRCLRETPKELVRALELTPYHRSVFERACEADLRDETIDRIERARLLFVRVQQGATASGSDATPGQWFRSLYLSRRGRNQEVSKWQNKISDLEQIADRISRVSFDAKDAIDVIGDYDSDETLFYVDPPYHPDTAGSDTDRSYYETMLSAEDHERLATVVNSAEGMVAISGYDNEYYHDWFSDWMCVADKERTSTMNSNGQDSSNTRTNTEVLWTNYDPETVGPETPTSAQATLAGDD